MNKLLILDLDETLIHATAEKLSIQEDFCFDKYFVYKRPHLDWFLSEISKHFKVGIWSSASDEYVNGVVQQLAINGVNFEIIWGRSRCTNKRDIENDTFVFEKRLKKLRKKNFKLEKIIMVDDSPEKTKTNFGNAIYVSGFKGNSNDTELRDLHDYLVSKIKALENVRTIEKRHWKSEYL